MIATSWPVPSEDSLKGATQMFKLSTLCFAVATFAVLLVTSNGALAQRRNFERPRNAGSTISVAPMRIRRSAPRQEPRWEQATNQDLINARYQRLQQKYRRPLDYPNSAEMARQDILRQRAEREVLGNSYRPSRKRAAINALLTLFGVGN